MTEGTYRGVVGARALIPLLLIDPRNLQWRHEAADRTTKNDAAECRQTQGTYSGGHEAADRTTKNDAADRPKELTVAGTRL